MAQPISTELYWLVLTTTMTGMFWLPYIVNRIMELGPPPTSWNPLPDPPPKALWAARAARAHLNAVENLVIFAPLVLAIYITHSNTPITAAASLIYFIARAAHFIISIFGIPLPFRTAAFFIGFLAQMTLAATLLGIL